jgi:Ca2+-binding RTX toxin-like protein
MSVIEVQATRASKIKAKPEGREKYQFENMASATSTPFYVGAMILALTMYLKSVLVPRANASIPPEHNREPNDQPGNSDNADLALADISDLLSSEVLDDDKKPEAPRHSSSYVPDAPYYFFDGFDSHSFELAQFPLTGGEQRNRITNGQPVNFSVLPSNDNQSVGSSGGGGGGNAGGGHTGGDDTGGPGDDDTDGEDTPPKPTPNRRPVVTRPLDLYDQFACVAVMIAVSDLLRGATDPDGDKLQIRNVRVSSGELVLTDEGYRFHGEQPGPVTITYEISDGRLSVLQTAHFDLLDRPAIEGTDGDDNLLGSDCEDDISGGAGDDQIDGRDGNDTIFGGDGDDHINGGAGNDVIFGGYGDDVIFGGAGNDMLSGGWGNDRLFGGPGNDILLGDADNDVLFGDDGNDVLLGDIGDDTIYDGQDSDHVDGGQDNDTVVASADGDNDLFDGGNDVDRIDYSASQTNITFDLCASTITGDDIGSDQIANFETYVGGAADDTFIADAQSTTLQTVADDQPETPSDEESDDDAAETAGQPVETFIGGAGFDTLDYSDAQNSITINVATGEATGEDIGNDNFEGIEHFVGGNGNDNFIVGEGSVTLDGKSGDDMFEFLTTTVIESGSSSSHHIVAFEEGDWVRMSKYDIFESAISTLEDAFEDVYGDGSGGSGSSGASDEVIPIRIRHEISDSVQKTFIDADFDRNDVYEISIQLDGDHHLMIINNQIA